MKAVSLFVCLALATTANAQFSVTGSGDLIPAIGTGSENGWDPQNLDHDNTLTDPPGVSSVTVPVAVTCIDSVEILGLTHTWIGDLQAVLVDPTGVGHNIFLRPALTPGNICCGNSGDFTGGDYTFVEAGTDPLSNGPLPQAGDPPPGIWDQSWESGAGVTWPNGDETIFNTPMGQITGPAGSWRLEIYDWAAQDPGNFAGWTLNGNACGAGGIGTSYCTPAIPNSTGVPGSMSAAGSTAVAQNNVTLTADMIPPGEFGYFLTSQDQGLFNPPNSSGFICLSGAIGRYNQPQNIGQGPSFSIQIDLTAVPQPSMVVAVQPGETWNFQAWYRDIGNTNNFTDGVRVLFL